LFFTFGWQVFDIGNIEEDGKGIGMSLKHRKSDRAAVGKGPAPALACGPEKE
jgi:hypothetical protein